MHRAIYEHRPDIDAVLISHLHFDHLDLPSLRLLGQQTPIIVPKGAGRLLHRRGFKHVEEMGVGESGLTRVVRGAFGLLDLLAFFTAGEDKPAQSWHLRRGLTAWHAAGEVHSDIQRGFVRAEVIGWEPLVDAGGYAAARERGTLRLEGRDYVMADGDVITVKFTP